MSRYHDCPFHYGRLVAARLAILAGVVCMWGVPARAGIVVQAKGLQTGAASGTSVHGQIRITNGLFNDAEQMHLKVVDLIPTTKHGWLAVDPNNPATHDWQERQSKSRSCTKWIRLGQAEVTIEPVGAAAIPVDIGIPGDANGLYRCAVVVRMAPPESYVGVAVSYDLAVPVLLEVEKLADPTSAEYLSKDLTVVFSPRPLKLAQEGTSDDPYHTYAGVTKLTVTTTSPLQMSVKGISATSAAGGSWSATIDPASFSGTTEVKLATKGTNVSIDKLVGSSRDVRVAEITLRAMPDLAKSPFLWRDKDQTPLLPDPNEEGN